MLKCFTFYLINSLALSLSHIKYRLYFIACFHQKIVQGSNNLKCSIQMVCVVCVL